MRTTFSLPYRAKIALGVALLCFVFAAAVPEDQAIMCARDIITGEWKSISEYGHVAPIALGLGVVCSILAVCGFTWRRRSRSYNAPEA